MKKLLMIAAVLTTMALMATALSAEPASLQPGVDQEAPAMAEAETVVPPAKNWESSETPPACDSKTDMLGEAIPDALVFLSDPYSDCTVSLSACQEYFSHWLWECKGSDCGGQGRAYRTCCCANMGGFGCMSSSQSTQLCC